MQTSCCPGRALQLLCTCIVSTCIYVLQLGHPYCIIHVQCMCTYMYSTSVPRIHISDPCQPGCHVDVHVVQVVECGPGGHRFESRCLLWILLSSFNIYTCTCNVYTSSCICKSVCRQQPTYIHMYIKIVTQLHGLLNTLELYMYVCSFITTQSPLPHLLSLLSPCFWSQPLTYWWLL